MFCEQPRAVGTGLGVLRLIRYSCFTLIKTVWGTSVGGAVVSGMEYELSKKHPLLFETLALVRRQPSLFGEAVLLDIPWRRKTHNSPEFGV